MSSRGMVREVQAPQKTPPHLRQCCRRLVSRDVYRTRLEWTYVFALKERERDATVEVVARGRRGIGLQREMRGKTIRERTTDIPSRDPWRGGRRGGR